MPKVLFEQSDAALESIRNVLARYETEHPGSEVALYRQNSVSVRIRIIDPSFSGLSRSERSRRVWPHLRSLPDEVQSDVTMLLLLTPEETAESFANFDFLNPLHSDL